MMAAGRISAQLAAGVMALVTAFAADTALAGPEDDRLSAAGEVALPEAAASDEQLQQEAGGAPWPENAATVSAGMTREWQPVEAPEAIQAPGGHIGTVQELSEMAAGRPVDVIR